MTPAAGRRSIAQVASFYPPRLGGVENVAQTLDELLARHDDVAVLTTTCGSDGAPRRETRNDVRVRRCRGASFAHTPFSLGLVGALLLLSRRTIVHAHVAQAFLPEVVWLTSKLRRRRYVLHFHLDVDPSGRFGFLLPAYKRRVLAPILRGAAAVIALSTDQAGILTTVYGVPAERVTVIPNGVGPGFYRAATDHDDHHHDPVRILFVGRLDAQKNVARLLDAMPSVGARTELTIVGDGEQRAELQERLARTGTPDVRFAGAQRGEDLLAWYRWADMFVLPSDKEGMPLVLLEAMAAGLPIVATDVTGIRDVAAGVAVLAPPTPADLGAAIDRVAGDPQLRRELAAASTERAADLSWEQRITELTSLYDRVGSR